jgi:peptide/nickel transport system substrate-binding protein
MINVYQGLVMFSYISTTQFAPILAKDWSAAPNSTTYTFDLRSNAWFANGHQFNASVVWYNYYRSILMNQLGASFFTNILYNGTTAFSAGYNLPSGVVAAMTANGYKFSQTNSTLQAQQAASALATMLSKFNPSNSTIQKIIAYPHQAVQVVSNYVVRFNLIQPYRLFLYVMASPGTLIADPGYINQNGGVSPNSQNSFMNTHSMGSGPYITRSYTPGEVLVFQANPNYWAAKLSASETNVMLTPPHIHVIITQYFNGGTSQMVQGFENNQAGMIQGPPLPSINLAPSFLPSLSQMVGINITAYPGAPKFAFLMAALDTQKYPTNITNFRLAVAHAVNVSQIIQTVLSGYGQPYVGPIPPGLPYYNPTKLPQYRFDPELSIQLLSKLGFSLNLPNGTVINPNGKQVPTLIFGYTAGDAAQEKLVQEMQIWLQTVGVPTKLTPYTGAIETSILTQPGNAPTYPNIMIWYWYPGWLDPVYQDMVAQVNGLYGGFAGNVAWLNNATINQLTSQLPFISNQALYNSTVNKVYGMVYQQVPDVWLYASVEYSMTRSYLGGVVFNAGLTGTYFAFLYYKSTS